MPTLSARATLSASSGAYSPSSPSVPAEHHGGQRLVGVLAGRNGLGVADGDLAVQVRDVSDGLDLGIGALGANDHEVVDEHILTRVGIDEPGGLGIVHGALGGCDEHVDRGAGTHLLDKVAGRFELRVGKRGTGLVSVELLNLGQSLLERVGSEDLKLNSLLGRNLGGAGIGSGRLGRLAARAAGKTKAGSGDSRKRRRIRGEKPYRTCSTLSKATPGRSAASFVLLLDYTFTRIMFMINLSRLIIFFYQ